jgi:hypothetical protein
MNERMRRAIRSIFFHLQKKSRRSLKEAISDIMERGVY